MHRTLHERSEGNVGWCIEVKATADAVGWMRKQTRYSLAAIAVPTRSTKMPNKCGEVVKLAQMDI